MQVQDDSVLTHSSLSHADPDQEECGRPLSSDPGAPHPQRPANSRMRKLFASHKASKHTGIQVVYIQILPILSETFQSDDQSNDEDPNVLFAKVSDWEAVVYGKTEDQLIMTEQARQYLNPYPVPGSTSRALVL